MSSSSFRLLISLATCYHAESFLSSSATLSIPATGEAIQSPLFFKSPDVYPLISDYGSDTLSRKQQSSTSDVRREYNELTEQGQSNPRIKTFNIPQNFFFSDYAATEEEKTEKETTIESEFEKHGMPWKSSIDPTYNRPHLFYMPFWEKEKEFMKKHLNNLRPLPVTTKDGSKDLSYAEKVDGKNNIRMSTVAFTSDEFRKIRMTVYDAGNQIQVFTSLWYPQPHLGDLPIFATDFLQFNETRHICIIDLQPLNQDIDGQNKVDRLGANYDYEKEMLKPIRDRYPSLQEEMSKRFYDSDDPFFSKQMLIGHFKQNTNEGNNGRKENTYEHAYRLVQDDLVPAHQEYLESYLELVRTATKAKKNIEQTNIILDKHSYHDEYCLQRDPSQALLTAHFGKQFANDFVHDVMFPYSERKKD